MREKRRNRRTSTKASIEDEIAHLRGFDLRGFRSRGSLRRSDLIRNNCSARPRSRIPGAKRGRTSRSSPTAGNGIFRCGDRAPKTATKMRERRQRPKSGN